MSSTVIVKYNAGNVRSVLFALERLGEKAVVSDDPDVLLKADRVIFPGVGEASTAMNYLREKGLDKVIRELTNPVLGICLGMQLLCSRSDEGNTTCLGIFPDEVKVFDASRQKVPQMGWNTLDTLNGKLFDGIKPGSYVYFVHGYYVPEGPWTAATTNYIQPYSSALEKDNFFAVQFHPEKSGNTGEQILRNFLTL